MTISHESTIGMKVDAFIATMNAIPITYRAFVAICVIFSFTVLNSGNSGPNFDQQQKVKDLKHTAVDITKPSNATSSVKTSEEEEEPRPKWHILKLLNFAAVGVFFASIGYFAFDASTYLNDSQSLLKFLAAWSALMCYFFGFFGISFIDADELARCEQEEEQQMGNSIHIQQQQQLMTKPHPPAACTPVCSDPPTMPTKMDVQSVPPSTTVVTKPTTVTSPAVVPVDTSNLKELSNETIANMVTSNQVKDHLLEKLLDPKRAVDVRRLAFQQKLSSLEPSRGDAMVDLPYEHDLDYTRVFGANCEVVIGYVPLPVGMVGPITLNEKTVYFPMATTEGCLVASTNRGCKAITQGSGAISTITQDGITRAPLVRMNSAKEAAEMKVWCDNHENFLKMKEAFESTTNFGKLQSAKTMVAGKNVYIRLCCFAGDAMGMNMVSKGSLAVIEMLKDYFPTLSLVALSGNVCTDKKAAAINWIEGRGKSVVVEATIPKDVVRTTLKTTVESIVSVNVNKNLIGSAMAASIGGFNAHASNIVTAVFLATGQDPAQNVESSSCITLMEETTDGDLWISCTMPSIEVGTVGGGTGLPAQSSCLKMIGCKGGGVTPGENAQQLAHVVAAATMAGELSLLAALSSNTLVQAHMQHNRKPTAASSSK
jgi:hydroxymethylglutaryl-CoA reductase (NADPH)